MRERRARLAQHRQRPVIADHGRHHRRCLPRIDRPRCCRAPVRLHVPHPIPGDPARTLPAPRSDRRCRHAVRRGRSRSAGARTRPGRDSPPGRPPRPRWPPRPAQIRRIVDGSPAWKPQARLAEVTMSSRASSSPSRHRPKPRPGPRSGQSSSRNRTVVPGPRLGQRGHVIDHPDYRIAPGGSDGRPERPAVARPAAPGSPRGPVLRAAIRRPGCATSTAGQPAGDPVASPG